MLHEEAVGTHVLDLIKEVQAFNALSDFILVGGTALTLCLGHRKSVDIDLFSQASFNTDDLADTLEKKFGFKLQYSHRNTLKGTISGIFIDLITHDYPMIEAPLVVDHIRMASLQDISAMKVNAISGDGTRLKDFIDIYFLLKKFSFAEIVDYFGKKYNSRNEFHAIKSLTYFEDIDFSGWPEMILEPHITIEQIKKSIISNRDKYLDSLVT